MTPSELSQPDVASPPSPSPSASSWRRVVVYGVVLLALCVVIWALIEGGDRDLWTQPSASALQLRLEMAPW